MDNAVNTRTRSGRTAQRRRSMPTDISAGVPDEQRANDVQSPMSGAHIFDANRVASLQRVIGNRALLRMVAKSSVMRDADDLRANGAATGPAPAAPMIANQMAQRSASSAGLIRRAVEKQRVTYATTRLRQGSKKRDSATTPGKEYHTVSDTELTPLSEGDVLDVETLHVGRMQGDPAKTWSWVEGTFKGKTGFIRGDRLAPLDKSGLQGMMQVQSGFNPTTQQEQTATSESQPDTFDPAAVGTTLNLGGSSTSSMGEGLESQYLKQVDTKGHVVDNESMKGSQLEKSKTNLDVASGSFDIASGIFGFVSSIRTLASTKSDAFDKFIAAIGLLENTSKLVSGTGKVMEGAEKMSGTSPDSDTMKSLSSFSKVTGVVTDGLGAIKSLFDTIFKVVKQIKNAKKMSGGSHAKSVIDIVKSSLETAAGIVKVVKGIIDLAGGPISAGLANALPGLGIAIGAATLALQGFNFAKSWLAISKVRKIETGLRSKLETSMSPDQAKRYMKDVKGKKVVDKSKMAARKAYLLLQLAKTSGLSDERRARYQAELDAINEFEMVNEMKHIGMKRRTRAGLHIFTAMTSIAGDIATLSGVGAVAGAPLKIFSSGFEGGMVGFRKLKQFGRDKGWKGFNSEKSSKNKKSKRLEHAKLIMNMAGKLPPLPLETDTTFAGVKAQYKQIETLLASTGVDLVELYSYNQASDGPEQQFNLLVKAMAERE